MVDFALLRTPSPCSRGCVRLVAGLETLAGPDALAELVQQAGPARLVFSLDLKDGQPRRPWAAWQSDDPGSIAAVTAVAVGVRRVLVLDLARVGVGTGTGTEGFCSRLKANYPELEGLPAAARSRPRRFDPLAAGRSRWRAGRVRAARRPVTQGDFCSATISPRFPRRRLAEVLLHLDAQHLPARSRAACAGRRAAAGRCSGRAARRSCSRSAAARSRRAGKPFAVR